jgi:hypothetical protein
MMVIGTARIVPVIGSAWRTARMLEQDLGRPAGSPNPLDSSNVMTRDSDVADEDDLGEEDVPTVVLYVIAGLLFLSFSLYLLVGGGHGHFH